MIESETISENAIRPNNMPMCMASNCGNVHDGYGAGRASRLCSPHRRAFTLTAALSDALLQFLCNGGRGSIKPGGACDPDIVEAGTHFAIGLDGLLRAVFKSDAFYNPTPVTPMYGADDGYGPRWRVNFVWKLGDESDYQKADDDETPEEMDDDDA